MYKKYDETITLYVKTKYSHLNYETERESKELDFFSKLCLHNGCYFPMVQNLQVARCGGVVYTEAGGSLQVGS